jgi:hypothetical protein
VDPRRRAPAAAVAVLTTLLLTACANDPAAYPHGEQAADTLADGPDGLPLVAVYVVALAVAALIAAAAWLPGMVKSSRYRPQYGWSAAPIWFAGPADPVAAVEQARTGDQTRGGSGGSW